MTSVCNVWNRMSAQKIVRFPTMSPECLTKFTGGEEGTEEEGGGDKESSFIEGLLQIKVFYLMCLPVMLWMKVIRFTLFLFSFLLLDNWMKQLVEPLTTFLLGNNLVSRGVKLLL